MGSFHLLHLLFVLDRVRLLLFHQSSYISLFYLLRDLLKLHHNQVLLLCKLNVVFFALDKLRFELVFLLVYVIHPLHQNFNL